MCRTSGPVAGFYLASAARFAYTAGAVSVASVLDVDMNHRGRSVGRSVGRVDVMAGATWASSSVCGPMSVLPRRPSCHDSAHGDAVVDVSIEVYAIDRAQYNADDECNHDRLAGRFA